MNIRFEPVTLLRVKDLRYCEYCSQAVLSNKVHNGPSCILDDFRFVNSSESHIKTLNFEYYQCIFRNCTAQVSDSQDFSSHLTDHGIVLNQAKFNVNKEYQNCSDKSTQQQYHVNHEGACLGNVENFDYVYGDDFNLASQQQIDHNGRELDRQEKRKNNEGSDCATVSAAPSTLEHIDLEQPVKFEIGLDKPYNAHELPVNSCNECLTSVGLTSVRSIYGREELHCNACSYIAENSLALEVHMQSHRMSAPNATVTKHPKQVVMSIKHEPSTPNQAFCFLSSGGNGEDIELYKCTECSYITGSTRVFDLHVKSCIRYRERKDTIAKQQRSRALLKRVLSIKAKTNIKSYSCEFCSFVGKTKASVRMHHVRMHSIAAQCERTQSKKQSMQKKIQLKKTRDIPKSCPNCPFKPKLGNLGSAMRAHLKLCGKSLKRKIYKCPLCFYRTYFKTSFDVHERVCNTTTVISNKSTKSSGVVTRRFQCSFCPYKTKLPEMVKNHERKCNSVLSKKFRCKVCSDVFTTREKFNRHILNCNLASTIIEHCEEPPNFENLCCQSCSYFASTKLQLARHLSMCGKTNITSFRCQNCNHLVRQKQQYDIHVTQCKKNVTKIGRLSCHQCSYRAPNRGSLVVHSSLCGNIKYNTSRCQNCHFIAKTAWGLLKHKRSGCRFVRNPDSKFRTNERKLMKCSKCNAMMNYTNLIRHNPRCGNPLFDAFKCPHKNCHYIGTDDHSVKVHSGKVHSGKKIAITKVSQNLICKDIQNDENNVYQLTGANLKAQSCTFCPFTSMSKRMRQKHIVLCRLRNDGSKAVLACKYSNCFFLSKTERGMGAHRRKFHRELQGIANSSPTTRILGCPLCPYVNRFKFVLQKHIDLCRLRKNGCKTVQACGYSECFFLAKTDRGMLSHSIAIHRSKDPPRTVAPRASAGTLDELDTNSLNNEENVARTIKPQNRRRYTCNKCPFFTNDRRTMVPHEARCSLKHNGVSGIIECSFQNCHFLAETMGGYKRHYRMMHGVSILQGGVDEREYNCDVLSDDICLSVKGSPEEHGFSSFSDTTKKQGDSNLPFKCVTCPYSCTNKTSLNFHKKLCSRKLLGDESIIKCAYPGCHFLSVSKNGYNIHASKKNHWCKWNRSETELGNALIADDEAQNIELKSSVVTDCKTDLLPSLLPRGTPALEDCYTCEKCSCKCVKSDSAQIAFHSENCRMQLFDKFKLPHTSLCISKWHCTDSNDKDDERKDQSNLKFNDTENAFLSQENVVNFEVTQQVDVQKPDDLFESKSSNSPINFIEPAGTILLDSEPCQENNTSSSNSSGPSEKGAHVSDSTETVPVSLLEERLPQPQEDESIDTEGFDDLLLCVDAQYII